MGDVLHGRVYRQIIAWCRRDWPQASVLLERPWRLDVEAKHGSAKKVGRRSMTKKPNDECRLIIHRLVWLNAQIIFPRLEELFGLIDFARCDRVAKDEHGQAKSLRVMALLL